MQKQLMLHIVAGYPNLSESEKLALLLAKGGADYLEIQIPFSDPVADGPTIMAANELALKNGVKVKDCFILMKNLSETFEEEGLSTKLIFMTYYNIIFSFGVENFCKAAKEAGCWGLIVPDIILDEEVHEKYFLNAKKYDLKAIQIISPLTSLERLKKIKNFADGLVYCVSKYGTTGQSQNLNPNLKNYISSAKKVLKCPLAIGFGISKREHVKAVWKEAEVAVIGSKLIDLYNLRGLAAVEGFLKSIKGNKKSPGNFAGAF